MYNSFEETLNSSSFDVSPDKCIGFPGPGDSLAMAENPIFQYVGASGYNSEHQAHQIENGFMKFKEEHKKTYKNDKEEQRRKMHYRHNHRCVSLYT